MENASELEVACEYIDDGSTNEEICSVYIPEDDIEYKIDSQVICVENEKQEIETNSILSSFCSESIMQHVLWTEEATSRMLEIYRKRREQVANGKIKNKKTMWGVISKDMAAQGYKLTAMQIENKFKKLTKISKDVALSTKTHGGFKFDQATMDLLRENWAGKVQKRSVEKESDLSDAPNKQKLKISQKRKHEETNIREEGTEQAVQNCNTVLQRVSEAITNITDKRELHSKQCLGVLQQIQANQEYYIERTETYRERTELYRERKLQLMERLIRALEK